MQTKRKTLAWIAGIAAFALGVATAAVAAPPGTFGGPGLGPTADHPRGGDGPLGPIGKIARFLELTDEQLASLEALLTAHRDATEPLHQELRTLHEGLRDLLDADAPDATAIGEQVLAIQGVREELGAARENLLADFEALLDPAQLERWEILKEVRAIFGPGGDRGRGRGPGGDGLGFGPHGHRGQGPHGVGAAALAPVG